VAKTLAAFECKFEIHHLQPWPFFLNFHGSPSPNTLCPSWSDYNIHIPLNTAQFNRNIYQCNYTNYYLFNAHTRAHTQPFYGSLDFVWEPVPEETFTHSHLSCSSIIPYLLHLLWSMASSLFNLHAWQSFYTISLQVFFGLPLGLAKCTNFNKMHHIVSDIQKFKKCNLKMSVSNTQIPIETVQQTSPTVKFLSVTICAENGRQFTHISMHMNMPLSHCSPLLDQTKLEIIDTAGLVEALLMDSVHP